LLSLSVSPGSSGPSISAGRGKYELDLSLHKELQGDGLSKLDNKTVVVTGTLGPKQA
jgi:hypothetical protein